MEGEGRVGVRGSGLAKLFFLMETVRVRGGGGEGKGQ